VNVEIKTLQPQQGKTEILVETAAEKLLAAIWEMQGKMLAELEKLNENIEALKLRKGK